MSIEGASIANPVFRAGAVSPPRAYLSTSPISAGQWRLALGVVVVSVLVFAAAAPFATLPLPPLPAFLPIYQSALVINDLITAVLLFGQFGILRSRALLVLASAYLFGAAMAVSHLLSFPGLFAPGGLFGAGPQTTAWLYFLWHGGFPLLVIAYALLKGASRPVENAGDAASASVPILSAVAVVLAAACALTFLATAGHDLMPVIMSGDRDASTKVFVASACWLLSLIALPILWRRRPHSLVDLWLMVTLCVWIFDIALAAVLNAGRYDLGWYGGRVYGLLAASFVLMVLLLENSVLHAQIVASRERERRRALLAYERHEERLRILREIDRAIVGEQALHAIAGAVIQPLRVLLGVERAIVNQFDLEAEEVEWLAAAGRRRTRVGPGVRYPLRMMGDVEALKRGEEQLIETRSLPPGPEVDALLASDVRYYMAVPMIAGGRLIGAVSFGGPQNLFPDEQVDIAREVATQLAIAIRQSRLLDSVQRHATELESRVRERTAELQAANAELEAFSYSVSHDLRAPLRAVDGYARMLEEDHTAKLDDEGRRLLGVVRGEARRMGELIDDLLALSRTARQPPQACGFDMAALVREVLESLSAEYPRARIELGALPPAHGDRGLLKQVWANLVGNALKYSAKQDAPRVHIGGREQADACEYWVRDNGAGFDPRYTDKLFGAFQRLHTADEFGGTGVGLAIVQRVVARHGGRVWAEGAPGQGATFSFALPRGGSRP
ncbi:MAG: MASE4 domain-containing protein [Burkholderiales bacterium]